MEDDDQHTAQGATPGEAPSSQLPVARTDQPGVQAALYVQLDRHHDLASGLITVTNDNRQLCAISMDDGHLRAILARMETSVAELFPPAMRTRFCRARLPLTGGIVRRMWASTTTRFRTHMGASYASLFAQAPTGWRAHDASDQRTHLPFYRPVPSSRRALEDARCGPPPA